MVLVSCARQVVCELSSLRPELLGRTRSWKYCCTGTSSACSLGSSKLMCLPFRLFVGIVALMNETVVLLFVQKRMKPYVTCYDRQMHKFRRSIRQKKKIKQKEKKRTNTEMERRRQDQREEATKIEGEDDEREDGGRREELWRGQLTSPLPGISSAGGGCWWGEPYFLAASWPHRLVTSQSPYEPLRPTSSFVASQEGHCLCLARTGPAVTQRQLNSRKGGSLRNSQSPPRGNYLPTSLSFIECFFFFNCLLEFLILTGGSEAVKLCSYSLSVINQNQSTSMEILPCPVSATLPAFTRGQFQTITLLFFIILDLAKPSKMILF